MHVEIPPARTMYLRKSDYGDIFDCIKSFDSTTPLVYLLQHKTKTSPFLINRQVVVSLQTHWRRVCFKFFTNIFWESLLSMPVSHLHYLTSLFGRCADSKRHKRSWPAMLFSLSPSRENACNREHARANLNQLLPMRTYTRARRLWTRM